MKKIPFGVLAFSNAYGEMIFFLRLACFRSVKNVDKK